MEEKPIVTVIVPSYNHKRFVLECLDSIKSQTYSNIQWIVVDDGSKDGSQELLKRKQGFYGYELFLQENKGLSATLTDMIKNHSKGQYIACCASDDKWLPKKIELQVLFMESHPDYAMCYGDSLVMDEASNIIGRCNNRYFKSGNVFEDIILQRFHPPVNYMMRKTVLGELEYYPEGVIAEDFYMNCRIAQRYQIGYINEDLSVYRQAPVEKKRNPYSLLKSHEYTINLFKETKIYRKAYSYQMKRTALGLAGFRNYKLMAIKYLFRSKLYYTSLRDYMQFFYRLVFFQK